MRKALYFLGSLNDSDIDWLVAAGSRREITAGSKLIEEGRQIHSVYLVIDGAFMVRSGDREVARLLSGEVMGEMSFVDHALPAATIVALETSFVLDIPRHRLDARLAGDTGFAARFYRALSLCLAARLRTADAALAGHPQGGSEGEIGFDALDDISVAGVRLDWVQKRLRSA